MGQRTAAQLRAARVRRPAGAPTHARGRERLEPLSRGRGRQAAQRRGVEINLGAHGQREGLAAHWELWMFMQGGMTPHEALRAGTINGARYLGFDKDLGSLEVGKLADLAIIAGDPLADIRVSEKVAYTVINGRIYDAATMAELGNHASEPAKLWWQLDAAGRPDGALPVSGSSSVFGADALGPESMCQHPH